MNQQTFLICVLLSIPAGYLLQRVYARTLAVAAIGILVTAIVALIFPVIAGFETMQIFALIFASSFGIRFAEKQQSRAKLKVARPQYKYCPSCRSPLAEKEIGGNKALGCTFCSFAYWNNPIPVAAAVIPHKLGVVLVKRKLEPRKGKWALPAGFIQPFETPEQGAARESKEEASVDIEIERPLFNFAPPGVNQILMFFVAKEIDQTPVAADDAEEAQVFALDNLPEDMAFPSHVEAINRWRASAGR
ncbi:MAG: NUDIX domain-containing protein [Leptolyngbya sp.]|nr:NUDIX domain-containing protein [Candidatus Melainabacteria bacterium]